MEGAFQASPKWPTRAPNSPTSLRPVNFSKSSWVIRFSEFQMAARKMYFLGLRKKKGLFRNGGMGKYPPLNTNVGSAKVDINMELCFLGRSEGATFWKANVESQPFRLDLPSNIIQKISGNLSPLTSEFPGPVPVASENDLEDTKTIHLDASTVATICYLHPSKRFFGSQTWDSKPPHRREVDRWVARTQKELPRESLATSLVKCWKTTREFERRECWAKSLRSAQAAWQNEEHVVSQDKMQNGSSTHIVSCVSMRPICISPYQCIV